MKRLLITAILAASVSYTGLITTLPAQAATLPFCTQHQLKVKAYEDGTCRIWMRNAIGGGQVRKHRR
jgi:hypothetical protein